MKLARIIERLNLDVLTAEDQGDREVSSGYVSDLLSDVMGHSRSGDLWITLQTHQNIGAGPEEGMPEQETPAALIPFLVHLFELVLFVGLASEGLDNPNAREVLLERRA